MITLEIPELTPSLNELMRDLRNPHVRKAEQEKWNWLVHAAHSRARTRVMDAIDCCEVIVSRCGPRGLDFDNMAGGLKFLFDALRHNSLIVDDNPRVVTSLTMRQPKVPKKEAHTLVEIVPLMLES